MTSRILVGPPSEKLPNISLGQLLLDGLRDGTTQTLQVNVNSGDVLGRRELLTKSVTLARELEKRNIGFGDRVAIGSDNHINWAIPMCATVYVGGIVAPFNPAYTEDEIRHSLSISRPKIIFVTRQTEKLVSEIVRTLEWRVELISLDEPVSKETTALAEILRGGDRNANANNYRPAVINDTRKSYAAILSSSGTTGLPKGVGLSHNNLRMTLKHLPADDYLNIQRGDRVISFLNFFHGYGLALLLAAITRDASLYILTKFDKGLFLEAIQKYRITHLPLVPTVAVFIAKDPRVENYDFSSVKEIICGSAPLSKEVETTIKRKLGAKCIRNAYGMTELSVVVTMPGRLDDSEGSVGNIFHGVMCKVIDPETSEILSERRIGEICFKGDHVMLGYYGNPKATKETIDEEGWLHTGDLGFYDEKNRIHIIDRIKELIKYKGYQIAPALLERVLLTHPAVAESAVVGKPNEEAGELPMAFVVRQPGSDVSAQSIIDFVNERVSNVNRLRGGVHFLEALPKNHVGKILRRELRALISSL